MQSFNMTSVYKRTNEKDFCARKTIQYSLVIFHQQTSQFSEQNKAFQ